MGISLLLLFNQRIKKGREISFVMTAGIDFWLVNLPLGPKLFQEGYWAHGKLLPSFLLFSFFSFFFLLERKEKGKGGRIKKVATSASLFLLFWNKVQIKEKETADGLHHSVFHGLGSHSLLPFFFSFTFTVGPKDH